MSRPHCGVAAGRRITQSDGRVAGRTETNAASGAVVVVVVVVVVVAVMKTYDAAATEPASLR